MTKVIEIRPHQIVPLVALIDNGQIPHDWGEKYGPEMLLVFQGLLAQFQTNPDTRIRPVLSEGSICRVNCGNRDRVSRCSTKLTEVMRAEMQEYSDLFGERINTVFPKSFKIEEVREAMMKSKARRPSLNVWV
jgi:hypothetical protein